MRSNEPGADEPGADDADADGFEVRSVQPYRARKPYLCPGCNQDIPAGVGHLVAVPRQDPGQRRHWHRPCWAHRDRRRPGRG